MRTNRLTQRSKPTFWLYLPWWLTAVLLWLSWTWLIFNVDPLVFKDVFFPGLYLPLILLLGVCLGITVSLLSRQLWRGPVWAIAIATFLVLRVSGIGHIINAILISSLVVAIEIYWRQR